MCGSRLDVVLCSFAFERVHRRVPLCREHRQPLIEIDHFTRPAMAPTEDVPEAWLRAGRRPRRPVGPAPTAPSTARVLLLPVR